MKKFIKIFIEKIFYIIFATNNIQKIKKKIKKYEFISFDIFDTLIKRNVANPEDIFSLVEKKYDYGHNMFSEFKNKRIHAEKIAKKLSKNEEVSLSEIYNQIQINKKEKAYLKKLEIEYEKKYCTFNPKMLDIYNYCLENKKKIYITSDMYLPKKIIELILKKNGYIHYEKIYLSSDYKLTKKTGNLFKKLLEEQKISSNNLVHIGDSPINDFICAKKNKINSILIKK